MPGENELAWERRKLILIHREYARLPRSIKARNNASRVRRRVSVWSGCCPPLMAPLLVSPSALTFDDPGHFQRSAALLDTRSPRSGAAKTGGGGGKGGGKSSKNGSQSGEGDEGGNTSNFSTSKNPPGNNQNGSSGGTGGSSSSNQNGSHSVEGGTNGGKASATVNNGSVPTTTGTPHSGRRKPSGKVVGGGMSVWHVCDAVVLTAFVTSNWRGDCRPSCDCHPYLDLQAPPTTPRWRVKPRPR